MTIKNFQEVRSKYSWCDFEVEINHRDLEVTIDDKNRESPTLKVLSFALKTHKNVHKQKEIAMISGLVHEQVYADRPTPVQKFKTFSTVRKIQGLPLPRDFERSIKGKKQYQFAINERGLLQSFINQVKIADPDFIVCHGLTNGIFDILLHRINALKVPHWSRIGRFKR